MFGWIAVDLESLESMLFLLAFFGDSARSLVSAKDLKLTKVDLLSLSSESPLLLQMSVSFSSNRDNAGAGS